MQSRFIDSFDVVLLDMGMTFMFGADLTIGDLRELRRGASPLPKSREAGRLTIAQDGSPGYPV